MRRGGYQVTTYRIGLATPLKSQEEGHYTRNQGCCSREVKLRELLGPRKLGSVPIRYLEAEEDDGHGHTTNGQVDVEAPSPCNMGSKSAANQRSYNRGNAKQGAE